MKKLPKIYYGYQLLYRAWSKAPKSPEQRIMLDCLAQSMHEIVDQYMSEFEKELYNE